MKPYQPSPLIAPAIVRDDYILALEHSSVPERGGWALFAHCYVRRWTPGVYKALRRDFDHLKSLIDAPINALHDPDDAVHAKFLRAGGFVPTGDKMQDQNGYPRERYVRA